MDDEDILLEFKREPLPWAFDRRLAGGGDSVVNYTVLAVVVFTLGLLLFVELLRHKLDHLAIGKPFFQTVLEGVYRELATLGMVEFVIFLLHSYYSNLDVDSEAVFAKVHFMLFYTALINALQSAVLAFFSTRVSNHLWVRTEQLEIDHYVEIRMEFEKLHKKLVVGNEDDEGSLHEESADAIFSRRGLIKIWRGFIDFLSHPRLKWRHDALLVQIRFHELRVHFLKANDLPLKFKLSDYLKRSELNVLEKLVHVSTFAWLLLCGAVNLMYFSMGMVAYVSNKEGLVGDFMTSVFFASLCAFVFISLIIFNKITRVFRKIVYSKLIDECSFPVADSLNSLRRSSDQDQLDLFWGRDPNLIIGGIQFMQFGFAIAISAVIIFFDNIDKGDIKAGRYLIAVAIAYSAFVAIMARVIPKYTLCTSLGQLVNKGRLHETKAVFLLEEARRNQRILQDVKNQEQQFMQESSRHEVNGSHYESERKDKGFFGHKRRDSEGSFSKRVWLAELTEIKTEDLRSSIPKEVVENKSERERRLKERKKNRRRSASDGVAAMRLMSVGSGAKNMSEAASSTLGSAEESKSELPFSLKTTDTIDSWATKQSRRARRTKSKSESAAIKMMQEATADVSETKESSRDKPSRFAPKPGALTLGSLVEGIPAYTKPVSETPIPLGRESPRKVEDMANRESLMKEADTKANELSCISSDKDAQFDVEESSWRGEDSDGEETVNTAGSEGYHSDFDDVPVVAPSVKGEAEIVRASVSLTDRLQPIFRSKKYRYASAVFGTLACFFLVGMRVEAILIESGDMVDTGNTWDFSARVTFWFETIYLCLFLLLSSLNIAIFQPFFGPDDKKNELLFAAVVDILICGTCLATLMVAEVKRACKEDDVHRLLGGADYNSEEDYSYGKKVEIQCTFGERTTGGLGNIEPFTSLIALRLFRFILARWVLRILRRKFPLPDGKNSRLAFDIPSGYDNAKHDGHHDHDNDHDHAIKTLANERGTIADLWRHAITLYPDIVERYGEFSGELLQAMLGLESDDEWAMSPRNMASEEKPSLDIASADGIATPPSKTGQDYRYTPPLQLDTRYNSLPVNAQSIILAGKIGKPVRSVTSMSNSSDDGATGWLKSDRKLAELGPFGQETGETPYRAPLAPMEFVVDQEKQNAEKHDDGGDGLVSAFIAPNARLERSMRRCDRKLLPLLETWSPVDVVMTKFEIVYFDAVVSSKDESIDNVRKALAATNGGKGLRLRDVAFGRKVVGHLILSDIDEIHVERTIPTHLTDEKDVSSDLEEVEDEYWKSMDLKLIESPRQTTPDLSRNGRWHHVKEDHLKIISIHGTLRLRFYSDLKDAELHQSRSQKEHEFDGKIYKNNSLQWCQTIVRFCGTDQFKNQKLLHYGAGDSEELRDYLQMIDVTESHNKIKQSKSAIDLSKFAERGSRKFLARLPSSVNSDTSKGRLRRSVSSGEAERAPDTSRHSLLHIPRGDGDTTAKKPNIRRLTTIG